MQSLGPKASNGCCGPSFASSGLPFSGKTRLDTPKKRVGHVIPQARTRSMQKSFIIYYYNVEIVDGGECSAGLYAPRAPVLKHHITTVTSRTCDTFIHGGCLRSPCWFSVSLVRYQLLQALHLKQRREVMSMRKFDGAGQSLASAQSESSSIGRSGL